MTDRLTGIEERLAHLQYTADELSDELHAQSLRLARLERQVAALIDRAAAKDAADEPAEPPADRRPPHW